MDRWRSRVIPTRGSTSRGSTDARAAERDERENNRPANEAVIARMRTLQFAEAHPCRESESGFTSADRAAVGSAGIPPENSTDTGPVSFPFGETCTLIFKYEERQKVV